jgi:hypothetical protein
VNVKTKVRETKAFKYAAPIIKQRELLENRYKPYESARGGVVFTNCIRDVIDNREVTDSTLAR